MKKDVQLLSEAYIKMRQTLLKEYDQPESRPWDDSDMDGIIDAIESTARRLGGLVPVNYDNPQFKKKLWDIMVALDDACKDMESGDAPAPTMGGDETQVGDYQLGNQPRV